MRKREVRDGEVDGERESWGGRLIGRRRERATSLQNWSSSVSWEREKESSGFSERPFSDR